MKTRAVLFKSKGELIIKERELVVGETDVLVKTEYASICGTDKNIYLGSVTQEHFTMKLHGKGTHLYNNREVPKKPFWITVFFI